MHCIYRTYSYLISQIFRVEVFADAASCEKGDWEQQLPSRIKISRMIETTNFFLLEIFAVYGSFFKLEHGYEAPASTEALSNIPWEE